MVENDMLFKFAEEMFSQASKIKELLEIDSLELGYHFQIQIDPVWAKVLERFVERAESLGYGSNLDIQSFIPKYERIHISGTKLNHLYSSSFRAMVQKEPFVQIGGRTFAKEINFDIFDDLSLNIDFGLALESEFPEPNVPPTKGVKHIFQTSEKDLGLFFHRPAEYKSAGIFSIGRENNGTINQRLDVAGPICFDALLQRVYLAALGRYPLASTEVNDNGNTLFSPLRDLAPGFEVSLDGIWTEWDVDIPSSLPGSWLGFSGEFLTIGIKIHPMTL